MEWEQLRSHYIDAGDALRRNKKVEMLKLESAKAEKEDRKAENRRMQRHRELPRNMKCPRCKRTVLHLNRWSVVNGKPTVCTSCANVDQFAEKRLDPNWEWDIEKLRLVSARWRMKRGTMELSTAGQLLAKFNWSMSKISKVRVGDISVDLTSKRQVDLLQSMEWTECARYIDYCGKTRQARQFAGLAPSAVDYLLGWSKGAMKRIENGERQVTSAELQALLDLVQETRSRN